MWCSEDIQYPSGKFSRIDMNNSGLLVEVFEGPRAACCYRIGRLNTTTKLLEWPLPKVEGAVTFASGHAPCVAVNNRGVVVTAWGRGEDLYYRVGDVSDAARIVWRGQGETLLLKRCSQASVTLNDCDTIVFSFTSPTCHSFITAHLTPLTSGSGIDSAPELQPQSSSRPESVPESNPRRNSEPKPKSSSRPELEPELASLPPLVLHHMSAEEREGGAGGRRGRRATPGGYITAVATNTYGHLVSTKIAGTKVRFYTGRLDHTHNITEATLRSSEERMLNTSYRVLCPTLSMNCSNLVVFSCHIAHGMLGRGRIVFTSLGQLIPAVLANATTL